MKIKKMDVACTVFLPDGSSQDFYWVNGQIPQKAIEVFCDGFNDCTLRLYEQVWGVRFFNTKINITR